MLGEAIAWLLRVPVTHPGVARLLGEHRGRANARDPGVPADHRRRRTGQLRAVLAVHQRMSHLFRQPRHRLRHRAQARLQNVDPINLPRRHERHRIRPGVNPDLSRQPRPPHGRQLLGVGQTLDAAVSGQHHGGRGHWASQRAPPHLIHPRDKIEIRQGRRQFQRSRHRTGRKRSKERNQDCERHCTQAGTRLAKSPTGYNPESTPRPPIPFPPVRPPLRTAVIGVGYLGRFHAQKYATLPDCELVGVVDSDPERLATVREELNVPGFPSHHEILDHADAVSIAVPTAKHYEITRDCLEAGCHALVEKPFTSSVEEAAELIELARGKGRIIQVGLLERFNSAFGALMRGLETPRFIEVHRLAPWNPRGAEIDVTLDLMIHDIDLALTVVGEDPHEIRASGAAVIGDTLDIANARLEFPGGCVANVTASRLSRRSERRMRVFQHHSCYALDLHGRELDHYRLREGDEPPSERIEHTTRVFQETDSLREEIQHFVDCVRQEVEPMVRGEDGLRALRTALEIRRRM